MKITEDILKNGEWVGEIFKRKNYHKYKIITCKYCGKKCFANYKVVEGYCDNKCSAKDRIDDEWKSKMSAVHKNKIVSIETRKKLSEINKGKKYTEETKKKMSEARKGSNNCNYGKKLSEEQKEKIRLSNIGKHDGEKCHLWKGGVRKLNIPLYETYGHQLEIYEEIRCNENRYLEVRCTYCGKWFVPKASDVKRRVKVINGKSRGELRLYCSEGCKKQCPIFGKKPTQIMKEDAIRAGRIQPEEPNREVQTDLRKLVLARDNYICQICGSTNNLHCHHKRGIWQDQLESADIDMCITLCENCHKLEHTKIGMTYHELRRKVC
jgi:hypothetical protein